MDCLLAGPAQKSSVETLATGAAPAKSDQRLLAQRLAVVARLNPPSARAVKRAPSTSLTGKRALMPVVRAPKASRQPILPTTAAVRALRKSPAQSAVIIEFAAARQRQRSSGIGSRAA
jgi:hypothetical protein